MNAKEYGGLMSCEGEVLEMSEMRLDGIASGRDYRVVGVEGEDDISSRLHSLGFLEGRLVRRRNTAPLGDPVAYEIDGQKISLRRREARHVVVEEVVR